MIAVYMYLQYMLVEPSYVYEQTVLRQLKKDLSVLSVSCICICKLISISYTVKKKKTMKKKCMFPTTKTKGKKKKKHHQENPTFFYGFSQLGLKILFVLLRINLF